MRQRFGLFAELRRHAAIGREVTMVGVTFQTRSRGACRGAHTPSCCEEFVTILTGFRSSLSANALFLLRRSRS